ncbi:response regulator [Paenibacillus sp. HW567]|uniref:response regulator n=1 Tax=Paenibacillus sp. HW567 TaxID=1034769 RepID=UPI0003720D76|nr:response regulator [Paenibacillus sp. HW567]
MIKILLADDEPIIIKGLRKLIDWDALGMEIAGQAYDGSELLQQLEVISPDLIISDIKMPNLSGIDIIKTIKERELQIKVIFISAYQEFNYARDAVAYGALDYLLKPIRKPQLEQVLRRAAQLINEEHEEELRKGKLQHLERKIRQEEISDWMARLIDGTLRSGSEAYELLSQVLRGPRFVLGTIGIDWDGEHQKWSDKETRLVEFAAGNILQELIAEPGIGHVFMHSGRHVYVISYESPEEARQLTQEIHMKIRDFLKLGSTIGISRMVDQLPQLSEAYKQAVSALELKYFVGINRVIEYGVFQQVKALDEEIYRSQHQAAVAFAENDKAAGFQAWNRLLDTIYSATFGNRTLAVSTSFSSLLYLIQELEKSGLLKLEHSVKRHELQNQLNQYSTYERLRAEMVRVVEELLCIIENGSRNKEKAMMAKVKQYIEEHYSEDVTLESAANLIFMNASYFSFFFKKHTGQNFKQYLTGVRLKHAVRLLLNTDLMVYEIADKVGYNNPRHFSDVFRKAFGSLPNEYRQLKKGSQ